MCVPSSHGNFAGPFNHNLLGWQFLVTLPIKAVRAYSRIAIQVVMTAKLVRSR